MGENHGKVCDACGADLGVSIGATTPSVRWGDVPGDRKRAAEDAEEKQHLNILRAKKRRVSQLKRLADLAQKEKDLAIQKVDLDPSHDVEGEPECKICMVTRIALAVTPCMHACICRGCYQKLKETNATTCPICRGEIKSVINMKF